MTRVLRLTLSLTLLLLGSWAFGSVVEPTDSRNVLQVINPPTPIEDSPFHFQVKAGDTFVPSAITPNLLVEAPSDKNPSFQFTPAVAISMPGWGADGLPLGVLSGVLVFNHDGSIAFNASYTGKEFDVDTGLYCYNARWYDPTLGRFITEDPARSGGNWYEYGNDNPLRFVDPTGLEDVGISGANGELTKQTFQDNAFNKKAPAQPKESLQQPIGTLSKGNGVHTPNMGVMDFINMGNESLAKDGFGSESFGSASWSDVAGRDVSPGEKRSAALVAGLFDIATLGLGAKALPGTAPSSGAQYVFDAKAGQYRDLTNGQFISPKDLPWPGNNGFSGKPIDTPLTPGLMLDRLGSLKGEFAGLPGASASERGLPAGSEGRPYTQLQVLKPLTVPSGPAAPVPAFGATGGGTQFQFSGGIQQWIDSGHLGVVP